MSTTYTIRDDPKMLRETLCVAQDVIGRSLPDTDRKHKHIARISRLITECDRHRPLGPNGKHGDRHTPTCGCDDVPLPDWAPTTAVVRAAAAELEHLEGFPFGTAGQGGERIRKMLAAALDVEEMAAAYGDAQFGPGGWDDAPAVIRNDTRNHMQRVRRAILGAVQ